MSAERGQCPRDAGQEQSLGAGIPALRPVLVEERLLYGEQFAVPAGLRERALEGQEGAAYQGVGDRVGVAAERLRHRPQHLVGPAEAGEDRRQVQAGRRHAEAVAVGAEGVQRPLQEPFGLGRGPLAAASCPASRFAGPRTAPSRSHQSPGTLFRVSAASATAPAACCARAWATTGRTVASRDHVADTRITASAAASNRDR